MVAMVDHDEVLTADEASAVLKVSVQTVLKESREGRLPGVKIGREWRYSRHALLRHIGQYPTDPSHGLDTDDGFDSDDPGSTSGADAADGPEGRGRRGTPTRR